MLSLRPFTDSPCGIYLCIQLGGGWQVYAAHTLLSFSVLFSHYLHAAPNDYVALNTMLVFTLGQTAGDMACASLDIVDDTAIERDGEDITLSLSPVEPAVTVVTASSATVAITENNNDGRLEIYYNYE